MTEPAAELDRVEPPSAAWVRLDVGERRLELLKELAARHRVDHNEMILRMLDEGLHREGVVPSPVIPFRT